MADRQANPSAGRDQVAFAGWACERSAAIPVADDGAGAAVGSLQAEYTMKRDELNDLAAFVVVAEQASFTRAAARLGISPSALSHSMKALETRLGLRLLARTTRSVATTEAGEQLLRSLRPAFDDIGAALAAVSHLRDTPAGTLRITAPRHAAVTVLWPMLPDFLDAHPDIRIELTIDEALTDIVASRYDAGVRFHDRLAKDMVALPLGPELRPAVVASPGYFARYPPPRKPQDLGAHRCINYRYASSGDFYRWEFEKNGVPCQVRVEGTLVFNDSELMLAAAIAGHGVAYLLEDQVERELAAGRLQRVLQDWCAPWAGYAFYYPSKRHKPPALAALVDAIRRSTRAKRKPQPATAGP